MEELTFTIVKCRRRGCHLLLHHLGWVVLLLWALPNPRTFLTLQSSQEWSHPVRICKLQLTKIVIFTSRIGVEMQKLQEVMCREQLLTNWKMWYQVTYRSHQVWVGRIVFRVEAHPIKSPSWPHQSSAKTQEHVTSYGWTDSSHSETDQCHQIWSNRVWPSKNSMPLKSQNEITNKGGEPTGWYWMEGLGTVWKNRVTRMEFICGVYVVEICNITVFWRGRRDHSPICPKW